MKNLFLLAAFLIISSNTQGQTILSQWNFNSNPSDANTNTGSQTRSIGIGLLDFTGGTTATYATGSGSTDTETSDNTGFNLASFPAQGSNNQTDGIISIINTTGYSNIIITWDQRTSNTASRYYRFQYSVDGTNYIDFNATGTGTESGLYKIDAGSTWFNTRTADLSAIATVNNNPRFQFKIVSAFAPTTSNYSASATGSTYSTSGTVRFDMVTVSHSAPLPITLLNFNAKVAAKTIDLTWTTATELNNNYFSIERSTNRLDFEELTRVQGAGNSTLIRNYSFTDANPANGINYYRLRQTDFNGINTASKVVAATLNTAQLTLAITQNSNQEIGLSIEAPDTVQSTIEVTDITGKVIQKTGIALQKGYNTLTIDRLNQQGVYFVKVTTDTQTVSKKLVF